MENHTKLVTRHSIKVNQQPRFQISVKSLTFLSTDARRTNTIKTHQE